MSQSMCSNKLCKRRELQMHTRHTKRRYKEDDVDISPFDSGHSARLGVELGKGEGKYMACLLIFSLINFLNCAGCLALPIARHLFSKTRDLTSVCRDTSPGNAYAQFPYYSSVGIAGPASAFFRWTRIERILETSWLFTAGFGLVSIWEDVIRRH